MKTTLPPSATPHLATGLFSPTIEASATTDQTGPDSFAGTTSLLDDGLAFINRAGETLSCVAKLFRRPHPASQAVKTPHPKPAPLPPTTGDKEIDVLIGELYDENNLTRRFAIRQLIERIEPRWIDGKYICPVAPHIRELATAHLIERLGESDPRGQCTLGNRINNSGFYWGMAEASVDRLADRVLNDFLHVRTSPPPKPPYTVEPETRMYNLSSLPGNLYDFASKEMKIRIARFYIALFDNETNEHLRAGAVRFLKSHRDSLPLPELKRQAKCLLWRASWDSSWLVSLSS